MCTDLLVINVVHPVIGSLASLWTLMSACRRLRLVDSSVSVLNNFLKWWEVPLSCSYWMTCLPFNSFILHLISWVVEEGGPGLQSETAWQQGTNYWSIGSLCLIAYTFEIPLQHSGSKKINLASLEWKGDNLFIYYLFLMDTQSPKLKHILPKNFKTSL